MTSLVLVYARSKVFLIRATAESRLSALILDCAPTFSSPSCQKPLSSRWRACRPAAASMLFSQQPSHSLQCWLS
jgi:hypothetical protein